jgi:hypothetical protein
MNIVWFLGGIVAGVFMTQTWRDWIKELVILWYNKLKAKLS